MPPKLPEVRSPVDVAGSEGGEPDTTIAKTLGYDIAEAERGRVVVTAEPQDTHLNRLERYTAALVPRSKPQPAKAGSGAWLLTPCC